MDEADFKQAIRLLHVWYAWSRAPGNAENPARGDALYPLKHMPQQTPLFDASVELLAKYPYESITPSPLPSEPQTQGSETAT